MNKKMGFIAFAFLIFVLGVFWGSVYLEQDLKNRIEITTKILGAVASVFGLYLGFYFLDRFGTGKKVAERQFESVVSLAELLSEFQIDCFEPKTKARIFFSARSESISRFKSKNYSSYHKSSLVFENSYFGDISEFRKRANSLWIPKEIKDNCQFLLPDALGLSNTKPNAMRICVARHRKFDFSSVKYGELFDGPPTFYDLLIGFERLIDSVNAWMEKKSGLKEHLGL